jgi:lysophospholipase L1-like esterase
LLKTSGGKTNPRWVAPVVLVFSSTVLMLLAVEGAARLALRHQGRGKEGAEVVQYTEYDPVLGWAKRPGARAVYRRREYTVEVAVNGRGLRDPERGYGAPAGTLRLLALGDSFVEGYTVPLAQTVTQVLEGGLVRDGCRAEVVNGGTSGYSTDQELLFYQTEGKLYSPRIVMLFFHYNDVVYNDRQEYFSTPKPVFEMGGGQLCIHQIPVRRRPRQVPSAASAEAAPESHSAFVEWIRDRMWYGAPRAYNAVARFGLWPPMPRAPTRLEMRVYERRRVEPVEDAWAKTELLLAALAQEVKDRGARLLVVYVPSQLEVDAGAWRLTCDLYGWGEEAWDRGHVAARLKATSAVGGWPVLDLTDPMKHAGAGWGAKPYLTYDSHWTALGHRVAAQAVARFLATQGWLEGCAAAPRDDGPHG